MKLAVDIGGSKTLLAVFDDTSHLVASHKFPTPNKYDLFLEQLREEIAQFSKFTFSRCAVAVPGRIDRVKGVAISCGNLGWKNVPIRQDIARIVKTDVQIENDANLGGLAEAQNVIHEYKKVLYMTISTGIGTGIIIDGVIDPEMQDSEGGQIVFEHEGKQMKWEKFASGKAITAKYGMRASDITDPKIWKAIAKNLALGIIDNVRIIQPDVVILGGGVGQHFDKFEKPLLEAMQQFDNELTPIPPIIEAKQPEEAVIYGCLTLMNQS
jgi:predicted NBD/HSP70 family sugar kinase